jgi:hypothetical protein
VQHAYYVWKSWLFVFEVVSKTISASYKKPFCRSLIFIIIIIHILTWLTPSSIRCYASFLISLQNLIISNNPVSCSISRAKSRITSVLNSWWVRTLLIVHLSDDCFGLENHEQVKKWLVTLILCRITVTWFWTIVFCDHCWSPVSVYPEIPLPCFSRTFMMFCILQCILKWSMCYKNKL